MAPTEGFDDVAEGPRRGQRGRRPPIETELAEDLRADAGQEAGSEFGLIVGDGVVYKVVVQDQSAVTGNDRWFTYGVTTSVQPGEEEHDAFARVVTVVHTRLLESIDTMDLIEHEQREIERERARTERIPAPPRSR